MDILECTMNLEGKRDPRKRREMWIAKDVVYNVYRLMK